VNLLYPHENWSKFLGYQGWVEILMITLVSSQKSLPPNISASSVVLGMYIFGLSIKGLKFLSRTSLSKST
jgi:hypothetical protein